MLTPDAGAHWQHRTNHAIPDHEGRLLEIQSVGRDVTEHRESYERVRRTAARTEALVHMSEIGVGATVAVELPLAEEPTD